MKPTFFRTHSALSLITFVATASLHAASDSWKSDAAGNWNATTSWTGGNIPGSTTLLDSADVATFGVTLTAARIVTVDNNRNIGGITFSNTSSSGYTLSGGSLRLSSGGVIQSTGTTGAHTDTISSAIAIQGDGGNATFTNSSTLSTRLLSIGAVTGVSTAGNTTTLTLNGANTGANAITGVIGNGSGGGKLAITKSDAGTWSLQNTSNSYSGGTTINAGTLQATTAGSLGSGTVTLSGGALHLINNSNTAYNNNTIITGDSQIASTKVSGQNGDIAHTLGTLSIGAHTLTLAKFFNTTSGTLTFGATTLTGNATFATNASTNLILGPVSGNFSLTKTTVGVLTLSSANSYSGATQINGGTVRISASSHLGDGSATNTISFNGGTLQSTANTYALGANRSVAMAGAGTVQIDAGTLTIDGVVTGSGNITKTGTGILSLTNASNSYSGATQINGGTVRISASNHLGDGSATNMISFNGGTLQSTANTYALGANRSVAMAGAGTVQVDAGHLTIDGAVTGTGNLAKTGTGILSLTNASHTGSTLIQNGVLLTNNNTSNIVLGSNSTFNYGMLGLTSDFTGGLGTAAGNVSWAAGTNTSGGFAVMDAVTRSVNIGGNATPDTLTVGSTDFVKGTPSGGNSRIAIGDLSGLSLGTVDFKNSINLGTGDRSLIFVVNGSAQAAGILSGNIIGSGLSNGAGDSLVKFGNGNLSLAGSNTYTGRTRVGGQGSIILSSAGAFSANSWMSLEGSSAGTLGGILGLGHSDLDVDLGQAGGNVHFAAGNSGGFAAFGADRSVTLNSGNELVWASTTSFVANAQNLILGESKADGKITLTNGIDLNGALRTVHVNAGTGSIAAELSGSLSGASGGLVKSGDGALVLSGTSTYTGATNISAGTLLVNGSLGNTSVGVAAGARLGGSGAIAGTVAVNGTLAPGNSIESLATGSLSLSDGSTLSYEMDPVDTGLADLVAVDGQLALTGTVTLNLSGAALAGWSLGDKITLISYFDVDGSTAGWNGGTFAGIADDSQQAYGSNTWLFNYNDGQGGMNFSGDQASGPNARFVTMTLVPEPSALLLGAMSALGLFRRRRDD